MKPEWRPKLNGSIAHAVADYTVILSDDERQPCEVWTRVMGYHRPVSSFNLRTTVHDALLDRSDLARLASELAALGVREHRIQSFRATGCANANLL